MGYYNPFIRYGEHRLMKDCKEGGVNGFVMADLPPEEAVRFRNLRNQSSRPYAPVTSPAASVSRMKALCQIANSFIYVISRMGVTGATNELSSDPPQLMNRIRALPGNTLAALGFGVSKREHFLLVQDIAEGCAIGSQIISVVGDAPAGQEALYAEDYLFSITRRRLQSPFDRPCSEFP
ncbi:tryptophan synthase alpha chain-domain-containing protein [Aspergillus alliaceus]|uniref:tryptophan synthase n=1 Tax=Petromyces alliaceus TaxID=209559 RepID=A0A5N7BU60_PETAA|nr:tryptophan synthase alpha chain-domain-containing protein [Aspergillus alliaceus]